FLLVRIAARRGAMRPGRSGSWRGAAALFGYAIAFSLAYLRIGAGVGSLVAFGAAQLTMIGWGAWRGERPPALEWLGLAAASAAVWLLGESLTPRLLGSAAAVLGGLALALAGRQAGSGARRNR